MISCQLSTISHSIFAAWVTAGVIGLAAICLVLLTRVLTAKGRGLETT